MIELEIHNLLCLCVVCRALRVLSSWRGLWEGAVITLTLAEPIPTVESPAFPESPERGSGGRPLVLHRAPTWAVSAQKDPARILAPGVEHGRANVAIRMGRTRPHRPVQDDSVAR